MHFSRRRNSELPEESHRDALVHQRRILSIRAKNQVSQAEKVVAALVAAEVDLERWFVIAAASLAMRLDRSLWQRDISPIELPMKLDWEMAYDAR